MSPVERGVDNIEGEFVQFNRRMEEGGVGEEVEQECMSMPSSSSSSSINDVILAPINHILTSPVERGFNNIEGEGMGEQPPSKPRYVPKPPSILSSSSSSSSINDVILAPINHILTSPVERGLDNIEGEGMGGQPPLKPRYVPKPPKRKKGCE
jgi:hypothetical protein